MKTWAERAGVVLGSLCSKGHDHEGGRSYRRVDNYACVQCKHEWNRAWQLANPAAANARARRWVVAKPLARRKAASAYVSRNRAKCNAAGARHSAAKLQAAPKWANMFFVGEAYDLAQRRTKATGFVWHVDHVVPLRSKIVCGLHNEFNVQVIPGSENCRKGNRFWPNMPERVTMI